MEKEKRRVKKKGRRGFHSKLGMVRGRDMLPGNVFQSQQSENKEIQVGEESSLVLC